MHMLHQCTRYSVCIVWYAKHPQLLLVEINELTIIVHCQTIPHDDSLRWKRYTEYTCSTCACIKSVYSCRMIGDGEVKVCLFILLRHFKNTPK